MVTLKQLININSLPEIEGEETLQTIIRQLACLEEVEVDIIKSKSMVEVNKLIEKYKDLFNPPKNVGKSSKNTFTLKDPETGEDKKYFIPASFLDIQYGQWEDINTIISRDQLTADGQHSIKTNLEKLPYLLATLFDRVYDNKDDNKRKGDLLEDYKKYLEMDAMEALAVLNFFTSEDKQSTIISGYYLEEQNLKMEMMKAKKNLLLTKINMLKGITRNGVRTLSDVISLKSGI